MTLDNRVQTEYGAKKQSKSKFVIVATHGAKDDLMTAEIAEEIAKIMSAGFVVNTRYKRIECDLNNIKDIELNSRKNRFYRDIDEIAEDAKQYSAKEHDGCEHAVIVHIHGMKNRGDHGIDIGIGAKWNKKKKKYQGAKYHPEAVDFETGKIPDRGEGKIMSTPYIF